MPSIDGVMPGICDAKSVQQLQDAARPGATRTDLRAGRRAEDRIRARVTSALEAAFDPIDDNAAPANKRITNAELRAAREALDLEPVRVRRLHAFNLLIQGSLYAANEKLNPAREARGEPPVAARDLIRGFLRYWLGDLAIDETDTDHSIATTGRGSRLVGE